LYESGLLSKPLKPEEDARAVECGLGFTDLAKTVAASSDAGLATHFDVPGFVRKMTRYAPVWIAFHGKEAARVVSRALGHGGTVALGQQPWALAKSNVFVLPSASASNRDPKRLEGRASRVEWFRALADLAR
jgi:double-stranded uracil-DNA glycosylase